VAKATDGGARLGKIDAPLPKRLRLTTAMASSSDLVRITDRTGPKTSSRATSISGVTSSRMVGPT
jgi:hypothetical protein